MTAVQQDERVLILVDDEGLQVDSLADRYHSNRPAHRSMPMLGTHEGRVCQAWRRRSFEIARLHLAACTSLGGIRNSFVLPVIASQNSAILKDQIISLLCLEWLYHGRVHLKV